MKQVTLILFLLYPLYGLSQPCSTPAAHEFLHANQVRAYLTNAGILFSNGQQGAVSEIPYGSSIQTAFFHALLIAAYDENGTVKAAAQNYGFPNGTDYFAGPLNEEGTTNNGQCANWEKVWSVYRREIEAHQADFADNGVIDAPNPAIIGWPGAGNTAFEDINGFALPEEATSLAPFEDLNGDGVYNPYQGEHPSLEHLPQLPEQICWSIFNDAGGYHSFSLSPPLRIEIQLTSWAYNCKFNPLLNQTIFFSCQLINKGDSTLDSLHIGFLQDYDIGCHKDDLIGFYPEGNTAYAFNAYEADGDGQEPCSPFLPDYSNNPPVVATTFLNQNLTSGTYYRYGPLYDPIGAIGPPSDAQGYLHYLSGRWADGTPYTYGDLGFLAGEEETNIVFSGNPNNPEEWSGLALLPTIPDTYAMSISGASLGSLAPGESVTLDMAYSFHQNENFNNLETVALMYEQVETLQGYYDVKFFDVCSPPAYCESECVWPGDANANGIANNEDVLYLGHAIGVNGSSRPGPLFWSPFNANPWGIIHSNGADYKHTDTNGSGVITKDDVKLIEDHYGKTNALYTPEYIHNPGEEGLELVAAEAGSFINMNAGDDATALGRITGYEGLKGVCFTLVYDPLYFKKVIFYNAIDNMNNEIELKESFPDKSELQYGHYYLEDGQFIQDGEMLISIGAFVRDDLNELNLPDNTSQIQFVNAKGILEDGTVISLTSLEFEATFNIMTSTEPLPNDPAEIILMPNPTSDRLVVQSSNINIQQIQVLTATGQSIFTIDTTNTNEYELHLERLPAGLYFIEVNTSYGRFSKRFIKL